MTSKQEQVFDILARITKKDRASIKPESELLADLGIDSPTGLQMLNELEDTLKIEIGENDPARFNTVNDVLLFVATKG